VRRDYNDIKFLDYCCRGPSRRDEDFVNVSSSRQARVYRFQYDDEGFFYKIYLPRNALERFKEIFRGTRAERALRGYLVLKENGLETPQVVMVGKKDRLNFMVSKAVEKGHGWRDHFKKEWNRILPKEDLERKRESIRRLGKTVGFMHSQGIFHGDLRWGNIMIIFSDSTGPDFVFLDNERTVRYSRLPRIRRVQNLVQINMVTYPSVTNTDRARFFKSYLMENPGLLSKKKTLALNVAKLTKMRLQKKGMI
jgi:tRNA A-37 threonylcarbamoyl transferase component Bud32